MQSVLSKVRKWFSPMRQLDPIDRPVEVVQAHVDALESDVVRHGTITVLHNAISVVDPDGSGSFASLTIPAQAPFSITIDGMRRVGQVLVRQGQDVQVAFANTWPKRTFSSRVTDDAMKVIARVNVTLGEHYTLVDVESAHHAVLAVQRETIYPMPASFADVVADLVVGYSGAIDEGELLALCQATQTIEACIIQGCPPRKGVAARYRPMRFPKVYDPVHRRMRIVTVTMGTTVAVLEKGIPGVSGQDVYGREVPAPKHRALPVLGEGVIEVNGQVVAVRNGRFLYTRQRIDVVPELVIGHDLSNRDGSVEFDGNVIVLGSVLDGSLIKATGSVEVQGSVMQSTVLGERGVFVGKAIVGAKVIAGQSKLLYKGVYRSIQKTVVAFRRFQIEHAELVTHVHSQRTQDESIPLLADLLLAKRHHALEQSLAEIAEDAWQIMQVDDRYREIVHILRTRWMGIARTRISEQDVARLGSLLELYKAYVEAMMSADPAEIKAASVTSSHLQASGKIEITGMGTYASTMEAGHSILVRGSVRGGSMVAESMVRVNELGTSAGTDTRVTVTSASGKVTVRLRHCNTLLQVGDNRDRNMALEFAVVYRGKQRTPRHQMRPRLA